MGLRAHDPKAKHRAGLQGPSPSGLTSFPSAEVAARFCRPLEPVSGELGGTVTLACELSPAQAEVVWRCGSTQLRPGKRFQMAAEGLRRSLTLSGLRAEDAGEYVCESRDDRTSAPLSVRGTLHSALAGRGRGVWGGRRAFPGASGRRCSSVASASGASLLLPTSQADLLSTVPREVKFTSGLSAMVAEEGQEVTFQCVVTPSDAAVLWFRDGTQLQPSEKFRMSQSGASHTLTISGLVLEDAGQIAAEAEGVTSSAALRVRGAGAGGGGSVGPSPVGWHRAARRCPLLWLLSGNTGFAGCREKTGVGRKGWAPPLKE